MRAIFVGDEPSRLNDSPDIPFVGSKSHPKLMEWLDRLGAKNALLFNSHTEELIQEIANCYRVGWIVIALGNKASERLNKKGIEHFKLPHPSPRNRILNTPKKVDLLLKQCSNYIKEKNTCACYALNGKSKK